MWHLERFSSSLFLFGALATAVCYYPNGYSEPSLQYQPCLDTGTSMCCATNRTNHPGGNSSYGPSADICLENGVCENSWVYTAKNGSTIETTVYYRDQCTSTNWTAGGCLNICTKETDPTDGNSSSDTQVTPCDGTANSTTWCCGDTTSCCGTSEAVTIAPILSQSTSSTTSTSTSSATANPTTTTTTTRTASATPTSSATSGLSSGAKAGIGVGVAVGAIAVIFAAFFVWRRRARAASDHALRSDYGAALPLSKSGNVTAPQEADSGVYHEMDTRSPVFELPNEPAMATRP